MVDFKKRITGNKVTVILDPVKLYETLDRAHDKGPLRPAQTAVLDEWFKSINNKQCDVIVKLHTGQGKTLIGLLMLQSRLNETKSPALYLCPDNFLIGQTCEQARQFGIATCTADPDLPDEFLNGQQILVTSVQKLFNGLTRFGLYHKSINIGTLLMDDAHACSDIIREACRIRIPKSDAAYTPLLTLFASDLEGQGVGTYADICNDKYDAILPVPYWSWIERESDVARILSSGSARGPIKYSWPLIKDILGFCQCLISGGAIEIEPYVPPLNVFGTYWGAQHRIFMSATVTDDSFLIKGLELTPETITKPLTYEKESWSGEKMVLIPSLIHDELTRGEVVNLFAKPVAGRKFGIVAIVPSFNGSKDWQGYGSIVTSKENVTQALDDLRKNNYERTVVLVNRYDGIDLPDDTCRVLIFDGKPYSESLIDLYQESCRPDSEATLMRTVRTIEQGLGRSVRGEKDYSVIIILGSDLTRLVRDKKSKKYFSNQMSTQVNIGLEIAEMARQDIENGTPAMVALKGLVNQCLKRDADWKAFYVEQMGSVKPSGANANILKLYAAELIAEKKYQAGDYEGSTAEVQKFIDEKLVDPTATERGWYLQTMARYNYLSRRPESQKMQIAAYNNNRLLLRPAQGVTISKLTIVSQGRMERIIDWVKQYDDYQQLNVALSDILGRLVFGTTADKFERALDELSRALGFVGERPDKTWKEGPDNLWALDDKQYILWECKSEVDIKRADINKHETEQMNRSCAWFEKHYPGTAVKNIIIHPSFKVASAAALTHETTATTEKELKLLVKNVQQFFKSLESKSLQDLSPAYLQKLVDAHDLSIGSLLTRYARDIKNLK